ncbi:DUF2125 domain-containing protein [Aurantimonas aggregata]|uniref:DUF2125 domain-containing protein n=1 Tax=Aurantimonas aggregata TaxID=2047720 RepID=A0A6L9MLY1_9HYPH|nr:DUF2125 domain-containing protein [Aurantimonas aggregata]NDV88725.1 DUF2125 domain-containing protein [Aurantimonas aggregata]
MAASSGSARKAYLWIVVVAVALFLALTAAWYFLAAQLDTRIDATIEAAAANGVEIGCPNRAVVGYPFRLGLSCDAVTVDPRGEGLRLAAGGLRTAAQIYQPNQVVSELGSPLIVDSPEAPPLDIRWQLAQASASFWTEGLDRFSLVVEAPDVALAQPAAGRLPLATAEHLEVHVRRRDADLDLAVTDRGIRIVAPEMPALPAFDVALDATIAGAANWLAGGAGGTLREAMADRDATLRALTIDSGDAGAELSGTFRFDADGELSGDFELAVTDPQQIAALVAEALPPLASVANSIAAAVGFIGRQENGWTVIGLNVRDGDVSAGVIPLGSVPPLQ